jgi:hypothetical protein
MADNSTAIAEIEAILNTGVSSATVDGQAVTYDLDQLRRRLRELKASDDDATKRPTSLKINLSGF